MISQESVIHKPKVAMLQIENRIEPYFEWCIKLNKDYCIKHDIEHIIIREGLDTHPPYWWKVVAFYNLMKEGKYDIICWMDSDAFVYNTNVDIREFFESDHSMVTCPDPPGWGSPFMAAVYMVKNNSIGREMFEKWIEQYNPYKWAKDDTGKWIYIGKGLWAGIDYEQGAFAKLIMPLYTRHIKSLPWYVFHETNCHKPHVHCWSIHLPGVIKTVRPYCIISEQSRRKTINNQQYKYIFYLFVILTLLSILLFYILYPFKN